MRREQLREAWERFEQLTIRPQAGADARWELRAAFYAGALSLHGITLRMAERFNQGTPLEVSAAELADIAEELRRFGDECGRLAAAETERARCDGTN